MHAGHLRAQRDTSRHTTLLYTDETAHRLGSKPLHIVRFDVLICTFTILGVFGAAIGTGECSVPSHMVDKLTLAALYSSMFTSISYVLMVLPLELSGNKSDVQGQKIRHVTT
jgi:hypothetical protein